MQIAPRRGGRSYQRDPNAGMGVPACHRHTGGAPDLHIRANRLGADASYAKEPVGDIDTVHPKSIGNADLAVDRW